jgi:hypothetical protein
MGKTDERRRDTGARDVGIDADLDAFADWFVDWWLQRGRRLMAAAEEADPNPANRSPRRRRRTRWDEQGRLVVCTESRRQHVEGDSDRAALGRQLD